MAGLSDGGEAPGHGDIVDDADQAVVPGRRFSSIFTMKGVVGV